MDQAHSDLLASADLSALGRRIRTARTARGLTQTDLAGDDMSVGYVSRIEAGQRRPKASVLTTLARRLGTTVEQLLTGVDAQEQNEIRLILDFAELSLETGEVAEARTRAEEGTARAESAGLGDLAARGHFLHARALEALGELDDAILELEPLVTGRGGLIEVRAGIALCRCYRDSGDLGRAIDTGERLLGALREREQDQTDEAVQLAVTLAAAYFERGDTGHAVRSCQKIIARAEQTGSTTARASAYWNIAMMESGRGRFSEAVAYADRALALLSEGQDARNLARLRTQLGAMQLYLDPPPIDQAALNLERAARELADSSAGAIDVARNELAVAHARFLAGENSDRIRDIARRVYESALGRAPLVAADAKAFEGRTWMEDGDVDAARGCYREAARILTGVGMDRGVAQQWFELADLLEQAGEPELAREAYRSAAASTGLSARPLARPQAAPARDPERLSYEPASRA